MAAITDGEVVDQCAGDVGFLWSQRASAVSDPRFDLPSLRVLDRRVDARLDVLRDAGSAGKEAIEAAIADGGGAGEIFAAAVLALEGDKEWWAALFEAGAAEPKLARGLVSAIGWTLGGAPYVKKKAFFDELLKEGAPPERWAVGIAASAVCRHDPGAALGFALRAEDAKVKARALRAVGELGRVDLIPSLALGAEDDGCRFWSAWSGMLLGAGGAREAITRFARGKGALAERACALLSRRMDPVAGGQWLQKLAETPDGLRPALAGAAALGDPGLIPWVIACMAEPKVARLAGGALVQVTGVDFDREKLIGAPPEGFDDTPGDEEEVVSDVDDGLPWPNVAAVKAWWARRGSGFTRGTRYLFGRVISPEKIEEVLKVGSQTARASAAVERCLRKPGQALFEVKARGDQQTAELGR